MATGRCGGRTRPAALPQAAARRRQSSRGPRRGVSRRPQTPSRGLWRRREVPAPGSWEGRGTHTGNGALADGSTRQDGLPPALTTLSFSRARYAVSEGPGSCSQSPPRSVQRAETLPPPGPPKQDRRHSRGDAAGWARVLLGGLRGPAGPSPASTLQSGGWGPQGEGPVSRLEKRKGVVRGKGRTSDPLSQPLVTDHPWKAEEGTRPNFSQFVLCQGSRRTFG